MTILQWRQWTRKALLRELASWATLGIATGPDDGEPDSPEQAREDARLAVPLVHLRERHPLHVYRRASQSVVWHTGPQCPAWPRVPPFMDVTGRPGAGRACRVCC